MKTFFAAEIQPQRRNGKKRRRRNPEEIINLTLHHDLNSFSNDFPDFVDFIRRNIARFPLTVELLAAAIAFADPSTPAWAKAILAAAIAYVLCPLDAIPDFIPIVGWTDDVGVLGAAVSGAAGACVREDHCERAREILGIA